MVRSRASMCPTSSAATAPLRARCTQVEVKEKGPGVAARTWSSWRYPALLAGDLVVDALDVEVHAEHLTVVEMGTALAFDFLAVLADDRAFERLQLAFDDGGFGIHRELFHVVGHVGIGRHHDNLALQAAPEIFRLPGA